MIALSTIEQISLLNQHFPDGILVPQIVDILIWAKRAGLIPSLREQLDALQSQEKFRLSKLVDQQALAAVGEQRSYF